MSETKCYFIRIKQKIRWASGFFIVFLALFLGMSVISQRNQINKILNKNKFLSPGTHLKPVEEILNTGSIFRSDGKTVLYAFISVSCRSCVESAIALNDSLSIFKQNGIFVVGVMGEGQAAVDAFVRNNSLKYPILFDSTGELKKRFLSTFSMQCFLVSRRNVLVYVQKYNEKATEAITQAVRANVQWKNGVIDGEE